MPAGLTKEQVLEHLQSIISTIKDIFSHDTVDPELWDELDAMDEGERILVPMCVLDLKRIRDILNMKKEDE